MELETKTLNTKPSKIRCGEILCRKFKVVSRY